MSASDRDARAAIAEVLALYCHAIDRRRWDLMDECFHADATYAFGPIDGTWRDFVGQARGMIDPLPVTHHQLGQTLFAIDGDTAQTESYFTATHRIPADALPAAVFAGRGYHYHAVIAGRYVDRFACRDGRWRIAHRAGVIDWRHDLSPVELLPASGDDDPANALFVRERDG